MTPRSTPRGASIAPPTAPGPMPCRVRARWHRVADRLGWLLPHDVVAGVARLAIAAIFFLSGRTKVEGLLTLTDGARALFRLEYRLPLLPPDLAAQLAATAELVFPVLLVLGLLTRLSALALLGMTLIIQVFVYPEAWPTHLSWAGLLLYLIGRGGGRLSLDRWCGIR